ncbi:hypothetical protein ACI2JA_16000 [Alkalihalobacillus sp. NPDC078783]
MQQPQEINLLPERYKRDVTPFAMGIGTIILILIAVFAFLFYYSKLERERTDAVNEVAELQLQKVELEAAAGTLAADQTPEQELQEAITQLETYRVETSKFTEELIRLLPERGFFVRYFYQRDGLLEITVSFDQMQEAAQYYHELSQSPYVDAVRMGEIGTEAVAEQAVDEEEGASSDDSRTLPRYEASYELSMNLQDVNVDEEVEQP